MKYIGRVLSLILLFLLMGNNDIYAKVFSDTKNHWAVNYIDYVTDKGYLAGYDVGGFKPEKYMTKVEFYSIVNQLASLKKTYSVTFSDVSTEDWFYNDVSKAVKAGYLIPTTGKLYPNNRITREEVCEILGYMYSLRKDGAVLNNIKDVNSISKSAQGYVGTMIKQNIISGYPNGYFYPKSGIKRAEVAKIVYELVNKYNRPNEKVLIDSKIKFGDRNLYEE